ncbi:YadA-like family protein [Haemophilus paracuniculus]|uniref:YadA-like family protein n=1 Tax=Haemophilus paracuniculus TaxID=734 RepID=UPI00117BACCC|nr:YadA-like family protein [Haemophilus paracuniculus]
MIIHISLKYFMLYDFSMNESLLYMNKIFKVIWNNESQSGQVVSELAKNRGKVSSTLVGGVGSVLLLSLPNTALGAINPDQSLNDNQNTAIYGPNNRIRFVNNNGANANLNTEGSNNSTVVGTYLDLGTYANARRSGEAWLQNGFMQNYADRYGYIPENVTMVGRYQTVGSGKDVVLLGNNLVTQSNGNINPDGLRATLMVGSNQSAMNALQFVSVGHNITVGSGDRMVVVGENITVNNGGTGLGNNLQISRNSIGIGKQIRVTNHDTTGIGENITTSAMRATFIGRDLYGSGEALDSVVVGHSLIAGQTTGRGRGRETVIVGRDSQVIPFWSNSFGQKANITSGNYALAAGYNVSINGNGHYSAALGTDAHIKRGWYSLAITNSSVEGNYAVAIGNAVTNGDNSTTIGANSTITGNHSVAMGSYLNVTGENSGAFGTAQSNTTPTVNANGSYSIGNSNTVSSDKVFVLGNNISVPEGYENAVVLGESSGITQTATNVTVATVNGITYDNFTTGVQGDGYVVSVGNATARRQLINLAAGEISDTSTDAINGSQLYAVAKKLSTTSFNFAIANGESATTESGTAQNWAVNGTASQGITFGATTDLTVTTDGKGKIVYGLSQTTLNNISEALTTAKTANATANIANTTANIANTTANNANATANAANTTANNANTTANNANATANEALKTANEGWYLSTNNDATSSSNVKPGGIVDLSNTDGYINITQNGNNVVFNLNNNISAGGNGKDGEISAKGADGKTGVSLNGKDGSIGINGKDGKDATITVADGKPALDPKDGKDGITRIVYNTTRPVLDENGNPKKDANGNPILENVTRQVATMDDGLIFAGDKGEVTQTIGNKLTLTGGADSNKLSDNNIGIVAENGKLSVKLAKNIDLGDNSKVQTGNVSISSDGINAGDKKISNVADGELSSTSKDVVNGSQLHATNQNVTKVQNEVAKGWNIVTSKSGTGNVQGSSVANVKMGDTATIDAGNNINITQSGRKISIATSSKPTFETVTATQGVTIGQGNNAVNIGNDSAGNLVINKGTKPVQIKGVAAGTADTDAANMAQLRNVENTVNKKVDKLDKRVRGIGASSAAAASLPQVYIPGKSMVAAAAGGYGGKSAVAVGYSRASDNGKLILKLQGTANSAGHLSGGVGVGYQW